MLHLPSRVNHIRAFYYPPPLNFSNLLYSIYFLSRCFFSSSWTSIKLEMSFVSTLSKYRSVIIDHNRRCFLYEFLFLIFTRSINIVDTIMFPSTRDYEIHWYYFSFLKCIDLDKSRRTIKRLVVVVEAVEYVFKYIHPRSLQFTLRKRLLVTTLVQK